MIDTRKPFWAYPAAGSRKRHYFPAQGEVSGCRAYIANVVAVMLAPSPASEELAQEGDGDHCAKCFQAAKANR